MRSREDPPSQVHHRILLHQAHVDEPAVGHVQVLQVPHGGLAEPAGAADVHGLLLADEFLGREPGSQVLLVLGVLVAGDALEYRGQQGLDDLVGGVCQVVADLHRDPFVGACPADLEVPDRYELRHRVLVAVPLAHSLYHRCEIVAVHLFRFSCGSPRYHLPSESLFSRDPESYIAPTRA